MTTSNLLSKFAATYFEDEFDLTDIGHTDLKRNNVFEILSRGQILKIYSNKKRWESEVASLKYLEGKNLAVPKIIDCGVYEGALNWVVMSKLHGSTLSSIADQLTPVQHKKLLYDMGQVLSSFHQKCKTDQFGNWNEHMEQTGNWSSFAEFQMQRNRVIGNALLSQSLPEHSLFKQAYSALTKHEDTMQTVDAYSLCHFDFCDRNLLIERSGNDINIVGLIDFERSYPSDPESDLTRTLLQTHCEDDVNQFMSGYCSIAKLSDNFTEKQKYYLIALCFEICSWAYNNAYDYYKQAVNKLEQLV